MFFKFFFATLIGLTTANTAIARPISSNSEQIIRSAQSAQKAQLISQEKFEQPSSSSMNEVANSGKTNQTLYECMRSNGKLLTVAHTPRGVIPLIEWKSNFFGAQWTPEARCKAISNRFQSFSVENLLEYVSTGAMNNYPIICVSEEYGNCLSDGLLMTLEPQDDPNEVLRELFNIQSHIVRGEEKAVINLEDVLEAKPTLEVNEPSQTSDSPLSFPKIVSPKSAPN